MRLVQFVLPALLLLASRPARAETILQWFETPWREVESRMPEVALAGYQAIWLPPPTKAADGVGDVGFAVFDRFDLGQVDQRGSVATRYGTLAELQSMVAAAHRYGIRIYFDTVMNHNSNPARVEFQGGLPTPPAILDYPGVSPLDFHMLPANPGPGAGQFTARIPPEMGGGTSVISVGNGDDAFVANVVISSIPVEMMPPGGASHPALTGFTHLVQAPRMGFPPWPNYELFHYSLLGLIDLAIEQGVVPGVGPASWDGTNFTVGTPVAPLPLPRFIRMPTRPETYPNNTPVAEDIREYEMRWIRWLSTVTDADGFRLDAIKHVPTEFFAEDFPGDPVSFNKAIQDSYDARRGLMDSNDDDLLDDAAIFGESFSGDITGDLAAYRATGMRVLDFPLFFNLKNVFYSGPDSGDGNLGALSFPRGGNTGPQSEFGGLSRFDGVSFVQSHDECPPATPVRNVPRCDPGDNPQDDLAQAFVVTRPGDSVVFFDGNNFTTNTFVRAGRPDALGDLSPTVPALVRAAEEAARGGMFNRLVDDDVYAYERVVDGYGAAALVVLHDNVKPDGRVTNGVARFGANDPRPFILVSFPPGTVLEELTGNAVVGSETLTVLDPAGEAQAAKDRTWQAHRDANGGDAFLPTGHGFVYLGINNGPQGNFLVYAPVGAVAPGTALQVQSGGVDVATRQTQTVGAKTTFTGLNVPAVTVTEHVVGSSFTVRVPVTTVAGSVAGIRLDDAAPAGLQVLSATTEGAADGLGAMTANGNTFEATLTGVTAGQHLVTVRVVTDVTGAAPRIKTLRALISAGGVVMMDGGVMMDAAVLVDAGTVDASVAADAAVGMDAGNADAAVGMDASVRPDGAVPADAGVPDGGTDDSDNDGVPAFRDNCPTVSNSDQADFDQDTVGDACDLCPATAANANVDGQGCPTLPADVLARLERLADVVVGNIPLDRALDEDLDGDVDAVDLARAVNRAQGR